MDAFSARTLAGVAALLWLLAGCSGGDGTSSNPIDNSPGAPPDDGGNTPGNPPGNSGGSGPSSCSLSAAEQDMLAMVNEARASARSCGNESFSAAAPVAWNCQLKQAAAAHSNDMATINFFDHTGSDGSSAGDRITATGYNWRRWSENIAGGQRTASTAIDGWIGSPGHCRNLMNSRVTEMGMAVASDNGSDFVIYWTQVFATPAN